MADFTLEQQKALAIAEAQLKLQKQQQPEEPGVGTFVAERMGRGVQGVKALGDVALTAASSGVGEILGGLTGVGALLYGGSLDQAVKGKERVSETLTIGPLTDEGQKILETIAPTFLKVEQGIDRFSERSGRGNPMAATAIKTALLGGLEFLPAAKGVKAATKMTRDLVRKQKVIKQIAEDNGINLDLKTFGDDIVEAVRRMTPEQRAQNAPMVSEALKQARAKETARKDAAFEQALQTKTFIETRSIRDLAESLQRDLFEEGFDLDADNMAAVRKTLQDMQGEALGFAPGQNLAVRLNQLELIRRRINKRSGTDPQTNMALGNLRRGIDEFLDNEFNKIALAEGQAPGQVSAISGDPTGVQAWKEARAAATRWHQRFSEDKVISQLIDQNATPEQYRQWLMGASAMNARREAASTVRRMREILGRDHPALEGIRQDFIFELAEPLLKEDPNFRQFVNNYDTMVRRNPSLVKELELDQKALKDMRDFARVQRDLPPSGKVFTRGDIVSGVSRMAVGHQIAKAAVRVEFTRRLANAMAGVDVVTPKQIMADLVGVKFGEPAIPKASPLAAEFIAGAALTGLPQEEGEQ